MRNTSILFEPFVPASPILVERKLKFAKLRPEETFLDLGCGDGRVLIVAATMFGVQKCIGYEIQKKLVEIAREKVRDAGLEEKIHIVNRDMCIAELAGVDLINLYLQPKTMEIISKMLYKSIDERTRIVTQTFELPRFKKIREKICYCRDKSTDFLFLYQGRNALSNEAL